MERKPYTNCLVLHFGVGGGTPANNSLAVSLSAKFFDIGSLRPRPKTKGPK